MRTTSVAAKIKAEPRLSARRAMIYMYLCERQDEGATDQEMQKALNMNGDTLRPTRGSLVKNGLIYDSGKTRQNENGNECIIWVVSKIHQLGMF